MGQAESVASSDVDDQTNSRESNSEVESQQPDSMEALLAEAAAFGDSEGESLDEKAQKALECPCVAGLRSGPCGTQFTEAFLCFLKSTAEEKGSDCVHPFVALQDCIRINPDAFSKDVVGEDESEKNEEQTEEIKIIPPKWATERNTKL